MGLADEEEVIFSRQCMRATRWCGTRERHKWTSQVKLQRHSSMCVIKQGESISCVFFLAPGTEPMSLQEMVDIHNSQNTQLCMHS